MNFYSQITTLLDVHMTVTVAKLVMGSDRRLLVGGCEAQLHANFYLPDIKQGNNNKRQNIYIVLLSRA